MGNVPYTEGHEGSWLFQTPASGTWSTEKFLLNSEVGAIPLTSWALFWEGESSPSEDWCALLSLWGFDNLLGMSNEFFPSRLDAILGTSPTDNFRISQLKFHNERHTRKGRTILSRYTSVWFTRNRIYTSWKNNKYLKNCPAQRLKRLLIPWLPGQDFCPQSLQTREKSSWQKPDSYPPVVSISTSASCVIKEETEMTS